MSVVILLILFWENPMQYKTIIQLKEPTIRARLMKVFYTGRRNNDSHLSVLSGLHNEAVKDEVGHN